MKKICLLIMFIIITAPLSGMKNNQFKFNPFLKHPREKIVAQELRTLLQLSEKLKKENPHTQHLFGRISSFFTELSNACIRQHYDEIIHSYSFEEKVKALDDDSNRLRNKIIQQKYKKKQAWGIFYGLTGMATVAFFWGLGIYDYCRALGDVKKAGAAFAMGGKLTDLIFHGKKKYQNNYKDNFLDRVHELISTNNATKAFLIAKEPDRHEHHINQTLKKMGMA
jgi:nitrogen fixation-related uncharacterized protein